MHLGHTSGDSAHKTQAVEVGIEQIADPDVVEGRPAEHEDRGA